jgi:Secretion system C-terminal sorting domain/Electron transfer DM13
MKTTKTFLTLIFLLIVKNMSAQCTQNATGFGNNTSNTMYNVLGGVSVVLNPGGASVTLKLAADFDTAPGPDVKAYLLNTGTMTTAQVKLLDPRSIPSAILFGAVSTSNSNPDGAKMFTINIPSGQNISNYNKIFFYCAAFGAFWDFGSITPFNASNCAVLGVEDFDSNKFQLYPNPASNVVNFSLDNFSDDLSVNVYNTLGSLVLSKNAITQNDNTLNVDELNTGVYIIELNDKDNNRYTKRFIKQ